VPLQRGNFAPQMPLVRNHIFKSILIMRIDVDWKVSQER